MHLVTTNVGCSLIFLLSTGGPAEPLDITGRTLRFRGTPVVKHCHTDIDYATIRDHIVRFNRKSKGVPQISACFRGWLMGPLCSLSLRAAWQPCLEMETLVSGRSTITAQTTPQAGTQFIKQMSSLNRTTLVDITQYDSPLDELELKIFKAKPGAINAKSLSVFI